MMLLDDLSAATSQLGAWCEENPPELAIVLGSGWASFVNQLDEARFLPFSDLDGFPAAGVGGHHGRICLGQVSGIRVLAFQGRYHYYEGYSAWQVTAPVRLAAAVGCKKLLLTNASGGIHPGLGPGDFMLVSDHLNLTGINPLVGRPEQSFVDLTETYTTSFYHSLKQNLSGKDVLIERGVLAWMPGPFYETPAEINALECLGAGAVSMSTVHEALIARHLGLSVAAVALIANLAAGKADTLLDHADVLAVGSRAEEASSQVLLTLISLWFDLDHRA